MPWTYQYIGIPFKPNGRTHKGCDCWGLVQLVYREQLEIELYDYNGVLSENKIDTQYRIRKMINEESKKWTDIDIPKEFDVILMRGRPYHIGIVCGKNKMIHVDEDSMACIEQYTSIAHKKKILKFKRYVV